MITGGEIACEICRLTLERYFDDHATYPVNINDLVPNFISEVAVDPLSGNAYRYAVDPSKQHYHLGTTVETANDDNLQQDADFDSAAAGWVGGFNGVDSKSCEAGDRGVSCYDVRT